METQPQNQPAVRTVIFDLGGVILRTDDPGPRTALAKRLGKTYAELDEIVFANPVSQAAERGLATPEEVWAEVARLLNLPVSEVGQVRREFFAGDQVDLALIELIQGLRGTYKTALLSNHWTVDMPRFLREELRIPDIFDLVISSASVGLAKPDPQIFNLVLETLGVEAGEAVFVDDNLANIQAAGQMGIHAVRFVNLKQLRSDLRTLVSLADQQ